MEVREGDRTASMDHELPIPSSDRQRWKVRIVSWVLAPYTRELFRTTARKVDEACLFQTMSPLFHLTFRQYLLRPPGTASLINTSQRLCKRSL